MSKVKILCYGAGDCFKLYQRNIDYDKVQIVAVLDKNPPKDGKFSYSTVAPYDIPIVSTENVRNYDFEYIVIFSYNNAAEMHDNLLQYGVPDEKIIYAEMNAVVQKNYQVLGLLCHKKLDAYTIIDNPWQVGKRGLRDFNKICRADYVRIATLELLANELITNNVMGEVAEAGVFRGVFASFINELFPERNLYLFDTFEGFDDRDLTDAEINKELNADNFGFDYKEFTDTSIELVLSNMPYRNKCIVRKGYFPDTTIGIPMDVKFAFVSLDMDLYMPMLEGLKYFYPRMAKGGYILVHDYNNRDCMGVKQAADKFRLENDVEFVPIPDYSGSVILVKY